MRQSAIRLVYLFALALLVGTLAPHAAWADARGEAKVHYHAGVKAYGAADYRTAIKEFSAAQQLAPADLNNYNLALCYDKLGEAEPAIQYYKEYLARVPNADKRTEIEASISRLEGALQSAAAKRAEEAKRSEEARRAEQARLDDEMRKAAEAKRIEDPRKGAIAPDPATGTGTGTGAAPGDPSVGSAGTPSTGQVVSTGDAQLDRASAIDINAVRDQRAGMGTNDPRAASGPQSAAGAGPAPQGGASMGAQTNTPYRGTDQNTPADQPKKETPVYKKWWFWAVVVVSAVVVYQIVSTDSSPRTQARQGLDGALARPLPPAPETGGLPLLSW
jgi:hypothetical protein